MARILLIDDDAEFGDLLTELLKPHRHEVVWLDSAERALELLRAREPFDVILLDNKMPRISGLELLPVVTATRNDVPVILVTSAHHDQTVIEAMNLGAFAYAVKPVRLQDSLADLLDVIRDAVDITRPAKHVPIPASDGNTAVEESTIIGRSRAMLDVLMRIARVARTDESVLILGETGTGKELVARAIHTNSPRSSKPFVVMNCAAFTDSLLDDELFGHERGAWTGAEKLRKGRFEHAHGGTLFLDEVGDMPPALQVKLLRVLENREIVRTGGNDPIAVDVRILAATHRDLGKLARDGRFRGDLLYRLEGMTVHLPPLRERKDDIELLVCAFLARMFGAIQSAPKLHPQALDKLREYAWPGNVRQLQKVMCRAVGSCRGGQIAPADLDFGESEEGTSPDPNDRVISVQPALATLVASAWEANETDVWPRLEDQVRRALIGFAVALPGLSQVQLARRLGMSRNHLRQLIERYQREGEHDVRESLPPA
jgi:DNA-binding NtrC family response regulator